MTHTRRRRRRNRRRHLTSEILNFLAAMVKTGVPAYQRSQLIGNRKEAVEAQQEATAQQQQVTNARADERLNLARRRDARQQMTAASKGGGLSSKDRLDYATKGSSSGQRAGLTDYIGGLLAGGGDLDYEGLRGGLEKEMGGLEEPQAKGMFGMDLTFASRMKAHEGKQEALKGRMAALFRMQMQQQEHQQKQQQEQMIQQRFGPNQITGAAGSINDPRMGGGGQGAPQAGPGDPRATAVSNTAQLGQRIGQQAPQGKGALDVDQKFAGDLMQAYQDTQNPQLSRMQQIRAWMILYEKGVPLPGDVQAELYRMKVQDPQKWQQFQQMLSDQMQGGAQMPPMPGEPMGPGGQQPSIQPPGMNR